MQEKNKMIKVLFMAVNAGFYRLNLNGGEMSYLGSIKNIMAVPKSIIP